MGLIYLITESVIYTRCRRIRICCVILHMPKLNVQPVTAIRSKANAKFCTDAGLGFNRLQKYKSSSPQKKAFISFKDVLEYVILRMCYSMLC